MEIIKIIILLFIKMDVEKKVFVNVSKVHF